MRDTQREKQRHRQREKQAPCREPDAGLDPRTPGSCPGLKAGAKPLSHPGVPAFYFLRLGVTNTERRTEGSMGHSLEVGEIFK